MTHVLTEIRERLMDRLIDLQTESWISTSKDRQMPTYINR